MHLIVFRENFGTNPDHARNSLTNCGIRQPEYGDRRIHYMNTRKRGKYRKSKFDCLRNTIGWKYLIELKNKADNSNTGKKFCHISCTLIDI